MTVTLAELYDLCYPAKRGLWYHILLLFSFGDKNNVSATIARVCLGDLPNLNSGDMTNWRWRRIWLTLTSSFSKLVAYVFGFEFKCFCFYFENSLICEADVKH